MRLAATSVGVRSVSLRRQEMNIGSLAATELPLGQGPHTPGHRHGNRSTLSKQAPELQVSSTYPEAGVVSNVAQARGS